MVVRPARYGLRGDDGMVALAQWPDMDGFFVGRESAYEAFESPPEELQAVRVALRGVDWVDGAADRPTHTVKLGAAVLEVYDDGGHVLGDYPLWGAELSGSSEATLTARMEALPHAGAEWAWDRWRSGWPDRAGGWMALPVGEREGWLEVARIAAFRVNRTPYPTLAAEHEIDGSHIDDLASFFCAVGEALAGPGGHCGSSFADLADCVRYSPRSVARPRLVWRDMAVAEKALGGRAQTGANLLDVAVGTIAGGGIDVIPA
jgi:hypothetical protein